MTRFPALGRPAPVPWIVVGGVVLAALSMRGPIVAPSPVLEQIRADLGLGPAAAGLLTALPVLCFALAVPFAVQVIRRAGPDAAVLVCLVGVLAGTVLRSVGPVGVVIAGTLVIGVAITVGNVVVPVVVRRDVPPRHVGAVTGAYSAALNVGSMITVLGTAPLAAAVGWRWALALWGVIALAGVLWWAPLARRAARAARAGRADGAHGAAGADGAGREAAPAPTAAPGRASHHGRARRVTLLLTLAFAGQATAYYTVTTWLPTLLADERGLDVSTSGAVASIFQIAAVVGAFGVPLLALRTSPWVAPAAVGLLWCALPIGLLVAPGAYPVWAAVGGVAQGGGFTAIFSVIARAARDDREATSMSARVQVGGYLAATVGPPAVGAVAAATGGWTVPLLMVLGAAVIYTVAGALGATGAEGRGRPARR